MVAAGAHGCVVGAILQAQPRGKKNPKVSSLLKSLGKIKYPLHSPKVSWQIYSARNANSSLFENVY